MEQPRISTSSLSPEWKTVPAGHNSNPIYVQETEATGWPEFASHTHTHPAPPLAIYSILGLQFSQLTLQLLKMFLYIF